MIVDTSALIAILLGEREAERFSELLAAHPVAISAGTLAETFIVAAGRGSAGQIEIESMLTHAEADIVPVDAQQAKLMGEAFRRFGRGSGSPARLNYGDCFSYALAISRDEPLLFKGGDFAHTDARVADVVDES